jgi:hypothetical protein
MGKPRRSGRGIVRPQAPIHLKPQIPLSDALARFQADLEATKVIFIGSPQKRTPRPAASKQQSVMVSVACVDFVSVGKNIGFRVFSQDRGDF